MVAFMAWVAKKSSLFFIASVLIPLVVGAVAIVSNESSIVVEQEAVPIRITCMNLQSELIETITAQTCPVESVSLGEFALTESEESVTVRQEIHPILELRVRAAMAAAALEGIDLYITSGFRTIERQNYLFAQEVRLRGSESEAAKWVLPGDYSHHPKGLAVDINYPNGREDVKWLELNGFHFGLCRVYQNEWWHFEAATPPGTPCPALAPNALVDLP
jgi:LAS superfamily LD-carboxypeptidase LdcB